MYLWVILVVLLVAGAIGLYERFQQLGALRRRRAEIEAERWQHRNQRPSGAPRGESDEYHR